MKPEKKDAPAKPGKAKRGLLAGKDEAPEKKPPQDKPSPDMAAPPAAGAPDEEQPNVSPEEQQLYEEFVDKCYQVIYSQKTIKPILQALNASDDPKMNLANAVVLVVKFVVDSARKAGKEIPVDVLMHGGKEVLEDLADLCAEMGIHQYTPEELEGAVYIAADLYRGMAEQDGTLDIEGSKRDMAMAVQADREGRMDDIIPGASARFGAKKEPAAPEEPPAEDEEAA